jgi:hypothetical protein
MGSIVDEISTEFVMDGAFVGRFMTLDGLCKARIGAPSPRIREDTPNEHSVQSNAERCHVTSDNNIHTCPRQERDFVVSPKPSFHYTQPPIERERWPMGVEWRGHHGRRVIISTTLPWKAGLQLVEVIGGGTTDGA